MDEFPVPSPKIHSNILTEEEYYQRLENIIKRDYYPDLYKLDKLRKEESFGDENMSLGKFISTYTSDENVTLNEIIKKVDNQWYQKHAWMFQVEEQHKLKQAALQSNKLQNMVEGNRENNIQLNEYKALNPLYFRMDPKNEQLMPAIKQAKEEESSLQVQRVDIENTRFDDHHKPIEFAINQIDQKLQKRKLQENLNAQGVNVFFGSTPNLVGVTRFDDDEFLGLFSPAPQQMKTPLMTWGELGETPVRLDRSYMIPPSSQRDQVGSSLAQQLNIKKRNEQKQQEELLKRRLTSITPFRMASSMSSRANSEMIKNFLDRRGSTHTPIGPKSKNIKKQ